MRQAFGFRCVRRGKDVAEMYGVARTTLKDLAGPASISLGPKGTGILAVLADTGIFVPY